MSALETIEDTTNVTWKTKILIGGVVVGALVGLGTSYMLARASEEKRGGPPEVNTMEILKIAISVFGLIRGIAALGDD